MALGRLRSVRFLTRVRDTQKDVCVRQWKINHIESWESKMWKPWLGYSVPHFGQNREISGCSSVWLECMIWVHEVAGSNPVIPTRQWLKVKQPCGEQGSYGSNPFLLGASVSFDTYLAI